MDGVGLRSNISLGVDPLGVLTKSSSSVLSTVSQPLIDGIVTQEEETKNKHGDSEVNDLKLDIFLAEPKMKL